MKNLVKFQTAVDKIIETLPLLTNDKQYEVREKCDNFIDDLFKSRFIKVPLVGCFSAGKSSLLNMFTQKAGMLPVDTAPETAVAYELYYSQNETVELYRNGNKIDSKPLAAIKDLQTNPGDIAKVYCDSISIKKLQDRGIILVDMPGIGSGIERHDAAIFNYINSGTAFVLLVDAEQGSLRGSSINFMRELSQYNLFPAVLVSKIDKKPEDDVKDIVEYIAYQMKRIGIDEPYVSTVCAVNNDLKGFEDYISKLDSAELVAEKYKNKLDIIINSVIEQIRIRIALRNKDIKDVDAQIEKIDEEIKNVKAENPVYTNADTPEKSTQDILDAVRGALVEKSTEIAQMIIDKQDTEEIKSFIVSTVRTKIVSSLKEESEQYSTALGAALQESVQDIVGIELDSDILSDFADIYNLLANYIDDLLSIGGIWGEIAKIILPFLPDIINWLWGKSDAEVLEEVRLKVMTKCVDKVVVGLQPTILKITKENQKAIQEKLQAELVSRMESIKAGLKEKINDANRTKEEVQNELSSLNVAIDNLHQLSTNF